ncbi:MAG: dephospho-CoA kinase [Chloroflexi bacterium]|nr:dephospho-CoA kinase [Chloroflexota bacterium]
MTAVIGLTGGIGTGKSAVSRLLRELGAVVIDADRVGHESYLPGSEGWREIVEAFGEGVLSPSGEVDRKKLGAIVFGNPDALQRLNAILHPKMRRMIEERIGQHKTAGVKAVVVEAAILIEAGWRSLVDEVWVTVASEDAVIARLQARNNLPEEAIRARMRAQLSEGERVKHADAVIDNSGDTAELREKVENLWNRRILNR